MDARVDLVGLVTYLGHISTQRWSPIPVLTRLNAEQLCSCDKWLPTRGNNNRRWNL